MSVPFVPSHLGNGKSYNKYVAIIQKDINFFKFKVVSLCVGTFRFPLTTVVWKSTRTRLNVFEKWWDYIQYMVMLFHVVPCTMLVSCSVMGLYPIHGHVISCCSVYNVCELLRDGIISSTWSYRFSFSCPWVTILLHSRELNLKF